MRVVETIVKRLGTYLNGKKILEIACGDSEFSLNASRYAEEVLATDITLERLKRRNIDVIPKNVEFREMNATNLDIVNNSFDVSVCYNALGHLENLLNPVLMEMMRVTIQNGYLIFISTWKMDKKIIPELKNIISDYSNLTIYADIENSTYKAIIIKKENI
ncbi:MAG: class I SAM-dependent methyltransferase [Clostridium sp.]|uniref:class I SAM-dependent methyltransferase n=1 Tax=Clostridium sp. TaxID=1506 RepID=UPI003D6D5208